MTIAFVPPAAPAEETAVRGLVRRLLEAWGRGDGSAYGAWFTDDADYVAFDGYRRDGEWRFTAFHNTRILRRTQLQWMLYGIAEKLFRR